MPFEPIVVRRFSESFLTIDKYGRLRISTEAMNRMNLRPHQHVVVSVDAEMRRIGVVKQELAKVPNASATSIDNRFYVPKVGRRIADKLSLNLANAPFLFEDIGWIDEGGVRWRAFQLAD